MIEVSEPPKVEIGDIVKFPGCKPVRVVKYGDTCLPCAFYGTCLKKCPFCYRLDPPDDTPIIAFAEVL